MDNWKSALVRSIAKGPARQHLKAAEAARDRGDFIESAKLYRQYLDLRPNDAGNWIQYANCLKDTRQFESAEAAYARAIALDPGEPDVYLQLGHLMRDKGELSRAIGYFKQANSLDPKWPAARAALFNLGVAPERLEARPLARDEAPIIFCEIFDLISYLRAHMKVTGIQRVITSIASEYLHAGGRWSGLRPEFCTLDPVTGEVLAFDRGRLAALLAKLSDKSLTRRTLDGLLDDLVASAESVEFRGGDAFLIMGAFWIVADYGVKLARLKEKGLVIGAYIYDLIPMTHPHFVTDAARAEVNERFVDVLLLGDFFLTISQYVADEVRKVIRNELGVDKPVEAVPLGHELPAGARPGADPTGSLQRRVGGPFVLCVCTLEGRKNHMLLHRAWSMMLRRHGPSRVPSLVLVGRWGWRIEEFQAACRSDGNLGGKIIILNDLSDPELAWLYESCLFTVFPSFVEGWGLPVGESLAFGKPVLASNTTSIPEVGGELVHYFNPYDVFGAAADIERAIFDDVWREELESRIKAEFKPRTWAEVSRNFLVQAREAVRGVDRDDERRALPRLQSGKLYPLAGRALNESPLVAWTEKSAKLVRYDGWYPLEDWGCWSSLRSAVLRIRPADVAPGCNVRVLLCLKVPPPLDGAGLVRVHAGDGGCTELVRLGELPRWYAVHGHVDAGGCIELRLERMGVVGQIDVNRPLFVGLSGLAWYEPGDTAACESILREL